MKRKEKKGEQITEYFVMVACLTAWLRDPLPITKRFMITTSRHDMNVIDSIDENWHEGFGRNDMTQPETTNILSYDECFINIAN